MISKLPAAFMPLKQNWMLRKNDVTCMWIVCRPAVLAHEHLDVDLEMPVLFYEGCILMVLS